MERIEVYFLKMLFYKSDFVKMDGYLALIAAVTL